MSSDYINGSRKALNYDFDDNMLKCGNILM